MDESQFDRLAREWATRRTAIGGLVLGLAGLVGLEAGASGRGRRKPGSKGKRRDNGADDGKSQQEAVRAEKKKKCKDGTIKCGKKCVTASTDALNCGGCGNRCGSGQACVAGTCTTAGSVGCPGGQVRCNGGCVDTANDEAHCGGCGQACQGDLTCLSGVCDCANAGETQCGTLCVDTQSDNGNCGGCGDSCPGGQTCAGGQCVEQVECVDQDDCGGFGSYNDLVCRNGRCVCADSTEGICERYPDGRGSCHICCPGGSGECPGNRGEVCSYYQTPSGGWAGICNCPEGWDRCEPSRICVADNATDPYNCGRSCTNCLAYQDVNPAAICCNGFCARGCDPGTSGSGCYPDSPCGPNCDPCGEGSICCNMGPGTEPRCIPNVTGYCYLN